MPVSHDLFRRIALALPEVTEGEHAGCPTFLVRGKRFATLGWPDADAASLGVPEEIRAALSTAIPGLFAPVPGKWGERGHTFLRLDLAGEAAVTTALRAAWRKAAPKGLAALLPRD